MQIGRTKRGLRAMANNPAPEIVVEPDPLGATMRRVFAALLAAAVLAFAVPGAHAGATESPVPPVPPNSQADVLLRAAIEQLVEALGQALHDVPRYALPEVNDNGDIILRRLKPSEPPPVEHGPTVTPDEVAT